MLEYKIDHDSTTTKNGVFDLTSSEKEWWINKLSYFRLTKELENNKNECTRVVKNLKEKVKIFKTLNNTSILENITLCKKFFAEKVFFVCFLLTPFFLFHIFAFRNISSYSFKYFEKLWRHCSQKEKFTNFRYSYMF